jgi:hypothetical protein
VLSEEKLTCPLPSANSALAFVRGEPGSTASIIKHTLGRSVLIGAGLAVAGEREHLVMKSLTASMMIESFVLLWTNYTVNK